MSYDKKNPTNNKYIANAPAKLTDVAQLELAYVEWKLNILMKFNS